MASESQESEFGSPALAQAKEKEPYFFAEVWSGLRPYLVSLTRDFLISVLLWIFLWLFKKITGVVPLTGWPGEFLHQLHNVGTVGAFGVFSALSVLDIFRISQKNEEKKS